MVHKLTLGLHLKTEHLRFTHKYIYTTIIIYYYMYTYSAHIFMVINDNAFR